MVTPKIFSEICDRTIEKYFKKKNYYCIDGCSVYMIFDIDNFIRSFGTSDELIPSPHIEKFIRYLNENNIKNDVLLYENSGHTLDKDPETAQQARDIIEDYAKIYF